MSKFSKHRKYHNIKECGWTGIFGEHKHNKKLIILKSMMENFMFLNLNQWDFNFEEQNYLVELLPAETAEQARIPSKVERSQGLYSLPRVAK